MQKLRAPQAELRAINYGHFGYPLYDPVTKKWAFSKLTEGNVRLVQVGNIEETAPPTGQFEKETFLRNFTEAKSTRYDYAIEGELRLLVSAFPELQPCEFFVKPMLRLSEGVATALADSHPAMTDVLDTGNISYVSNHRANTIEVLAIPGGECGEALRLTALESQHYRTENDDEFDLEFASKETGWWMGKGAPILQICFSHVADEAEKNTLLAVRLQGCIAIMFPRHRDRPVPASGIEVEDPPPRSRIDPNVLFELNADQAQGTRFADVAFNPWNYRELIVIDQRGQWTTFKVTRKDSDFPFYEPVLRQKGQMPKVVQEETADEAEEALDEPGGIEVSMQGLETNREEDEESEADSQPSWMLESGIPQVKASISRKSSPELKKIPTASSSEPDSQSRVGDQETNDDGGKQDVSPVPDQHPAAAEDDDDDDDDEDRELRQDGWARAIWVLNANTLVVCSRKAIHIVNCTTIEYYDMPRLRMTETRYAGWFLDLKLCLNRTDHVFVLTSYSVFLVRVYETDEAETEDSKPKTITKGRIVVSALHFRDPADTTLRLNIYEDEQGYIVTIYSQFNRIMTCFRIDSPQSRNEQFAASEAIALHVPEDAPSRTLGLIVKRVRLQDGLYSMPENVYDDGRLHSIQFLGRDYGVRHAFFGSQSPVTTQRLQVPLKISGHANIVQRHRKSSFVVSDDEASETHDDGLFQALRDESGSISNESNGQEPRTVTTTRSGKPYPTPRFFHVASAAVDNLGNDGSQLVPSIDVEEISKIIQEGVLAADDPMMVPSTLFEHIQEAMPKIDDLRDASYQLEDALAASSASAAVKTYPRTMPVPLDFDERSEDESDVDMPFDDIHSYIQEQYVTPLKGEFPEAFREQRQWLAKSIAAEVMLASARIEHQHIKAETAHADTAADDLFVGSSQPMSAWSQDIEVEDEAAAAAQKKRAKSPYEIPLAENMNTILDRLRRNVSALEIKPRQKWALKPMVMLSHWELGADPADYSYSETAARLEQERDYLGMTEQEQKRLKKKRERNAIRKEREARKAEKLSQQSSQAPSVFSSQLAGGSQGAISQRSSPAPSESSQVPGLVSSQVPGFRSSTPRVGGSQRSAAAPGFGNPSAPARSRTLPASSASQASQAQASVPTAKGKNKSQTQPDAQPGPSQIQNPPSSLPARPDPISSQLEASQPVDRSGQMLELPSFNLGMSQSSSQMPSSQLGPGLAPRKVKKRKAGF